MAVINWKGLTNEEVRQAFHEMDDQSIKACAAHLDPVQIKTALVAIDLGKDPNWINKTHAFISGLASPNQVEDVAKLLSRPQLLELLANRTQIESLQPLFVGISTLQFQEIIEFASTQQIETLREESVGEPVQYHILNLYHLLQNERIELAQQVELLETEIENLSLPEIPLNSYLELIEKINALKQRVLDQLAMIGRLVLISWNSNRIDLINKIGELKESWEKFNIHTLGHSRRGIQNSSGLYLTLETKLNSVYGDPQNLNDIEALHDDEPAIDAIVKFSVWYLRDYWEIGLLPMIKNEDELQLTKEHQDKLLEMARIHLEKLGLFTVKDLKKAHIYSKETLSEFIHAYRHLLILS